MAPVPTGTNRKVCPCSCFTLKISANIQGPADIQVRDYQVILVLGNLNQVLSFPHASPWPIR